MGTEDREFNRGANAIQDAIVGALKAEGISNCSCSKSVQRRGGSDIPDSVELQFRGNGRRVIASFTRDEVLDAAASVENVSGSIRIIAARVIKRFIDG
jgi:hypothetical protein